MTAEATPPKPRLLVLNQYYAPRIEATARILGQLCTGLVRDFRVTVVTGALNDGDPGIGRHEVDGVEIIRVGSTVYDRTRLSRRAVNYFSYSTLALRTALSLDRPDIVLCMTDPPFLADLALVVARRFDVPLVVVSQDVFPEIAVEVRRLTNPVLVAGLAAAVRYYLRRADRVVAIGETMRQRLEAKGAPPHRLRVISNWADASELTPQPRRNPWSHEHGLDDAFAVMHSGNVGHAQDLASLVRSATFLRDLDNLQIVIAGAGAMHGELLRLAERLEVENVRFLPYQPREVLPQSLSSADVHVVGLARGLAGYVVPSRLYGILAVGRPVIVTADAESETAQLVREVGCGVVIPPGRPESLAEAIRTAYDGRLDLAGMGELGRRHAVTNSDRRPAIDRYRALLAEVVSERAETAVR